MSSMMTVKMSRFDGSPWGFRLQGGKDFAQPLVIQKRHVFTAKKWQTARASRKNLKPKEGRLKTLPFTIAMDMNRTYGVWFDFLPVAQISDLRQVNDECMNSRRIERLVKATDEFEHEWTVEGSGGMWSRIS
ncbi:hypothetical protein J437_LFUL006007 [Ladona fulva]|uniref:Uncharacterized protein n=1 Tax=Ladona fulva TaxID=123851 RepID=A0A8K0JZ95_LADFU|nr:hypothetical protein J437_LFUL006007 [Ladona fulva]